MLCKRLKKINLFLETAEKIFGHSEEDKRKLHVVKTMSILEIAKLKRQNVIFTKIELRSDTIIVL